MIKLFGLDTTGILFLFLMVGLTAAWLVERARKVKAQAALDIELQRKKLDEINDALVGNKSDYTMALHSIPPYMLEHVKGTTTLPPGTIRDITEYDDCGTVDPGPCTSTPDGDKQNH